MINFYFRPKQTSPGPRSSFHLLLTRNTGHMPSRVLMSPQWYIARANSVSPMPSLSLDTSKTGPVDPADPVADPPLGPSDGGVKLPEGGAVGGLCSFPPVVSLAVNVACVIFEFGWFASPFPPHQTAMMHMVDMQILQASRRVSLESSTCHKRKWKANTHILTH